MDGVNVVVALAVGMVSSAVVARGAKFGGVWLKGGVGLAVVVVAVADTGAVGVDTVDGIKALWPCCCLGCRAAICIYLFFDSSNSRTRDLAC